MKKPPVKPMPLATISILCFMLTLVPLQAHQLGVADFNGDRALDLAIADTLRNRVVILLGNGNGTFGSQMSYLVGLRPVDLTVGDWNNDGYLDLAVANSLSNTVDVLLGDGKGAFERGERLATGLDPLSIASGDVDADAILDLAVVGFQSNNFNIYIGTGDGHFRLPFVCRVTFAGPRFIFLSDLTGGGYDVPTVVYNSGTVCTHTVEGCREPRCVPLGFTGPTAAATGDFNNDELLDLVIGRPNDVCFLFGNGQPAFFDPPSCLGMSLGAASIAVGDIDGDGNLDIAVAQADRVCVLLGDGEGGFNATCFSVGRTVLSLALGDFNADDNLDLTIFDGESICVLLGDGSGRFGAPGCFPLQR